MATDKANQNKVKYILPTNLQVVHTSKSGLIQGRHGQIIWDQWQQCNVTPSDHWRLLNDIIDMSNSEHVCTRSEEMQIKSKFSQVSPKKNHWKSIGQGIKGGQMISIVEQRGDCSTVEAISTASFKAHCFASTITLSWP